jgi:hypothetical protein
MDEVALQNSSAKGRGIRIVDVTVMLVAGYKGFACNSKPCAHAYLFVSNVTLD